MRWSVIAAVVVCAASPAAADECVDVGYDCGVGYEYNGGRSHACCHGRWSDDCCEMTAAAQFWGLVWLTALIVSIVLCAMCCCCPEAYDNCRCCGRAPGDPPPKPRKSLVV